MSPVHAECVKPFCSIKVLSINKIGASILPLVRTNLFNILYWGLGVDLDSMFILCRSLIDFKE